jgi:glycosyltransferase involved in cell wall biosynthesis
MNGYNTEFHTPNGQEKDRGRYLNVITHGNFGKFQDVDLIVRLVEETKNLPIRYNFIGFGSKLKQIPRSSNVHIENSVPHNQIPERLINADVGLSFRTSDPIGRYAVPVKLLEYIGTSLPCIVSPVMPDLAELEEAGAIRQFESHQISEMVSFLEKLLQDPNFYKGMKHSAFEIRDNYSRDAQSQKAIPYIFGYSPQELIR